MRFFTFIIFTAKKVKLFTNLTSKPVPKKKYLSSNDENSIAIGKLDRLVAVCATPSAGGNCQTTRRPSIRKNSSFFLTEVGQITFGHLRILAPRGNHTSPIVEVHKSYWSGWERSPSDLETNLPEGPMPTNVKDFKFIELSYFDESVANFMGQFQQEQQRGNSMLDNVNLWFFPSISSDDDNTIMRILAQLMPMIGNINSMLICNLHNMEFGRLEPNNAASQLLTTMLTNARILEIGYAMHWSTFSWCDWLYTPRNDGKPRALRFCGSFRDTKNLIEQIKRTSQRPPVRSASSSMFEHSGMGAEILTGRKLAWTMARPMSD